MVDTKCLKTFNICAAVEQNFGIANQGRLPWPNIQKDYDYYLWLTSKRTNANKMVVNIKGRLTYENSDVTTELQRPGVLNIVISSSYKKCPEYAYAVVPNFEAALNLTHKPALADQVETVWVMGGQDIYKEAVQSEQCHRIYLTQIFKEYESDRFFPDFRCSSNFVRVRDPDIDDSIQEEDGIKFQFQVFERVKT